MATEEVTTSASETIPFDDLADELGKAVAILDLLYCNTSYIETRPDTVIVAAGEALEHVERVRAYLQGEIDEVQPKVGISSRGRVTTTAPRRCNHG